MDKRPHIAYSNPIGAKGSSSEKRKKKMIAGVTKLNRTTRCYKGYSFSYLPNAKRLLKVTLSIYMNDEFTTRRFHTITQAVVFIDDALANGAKLNGNRLVITKVGA